MGTYLIGNMGLLFSEFTSLWSLVQILADMIDSQVVLGVPNVHVDAVVF